MLDSCLFCSGSFGFGRSFGGRSFGSCIALAAAAAGFAFAFLGILEHGLVVVNKLDEASLSIVTQAVAGFEDTGVATGTVGDFFSYFAKEDFDSLFVLEVAENKAAVCHVVFLGAVDKGLGIDTQSLGLSKSGVDALVEDERNCHIGQQRRTVLSFAAKVIEFFIVSHRGLFFIEFVL